jgi:uncharacterized protein
MMELLQEGYLLRIFIGESDKHNGKLLYEWLVETAKEQHLAGATVLRGIMVWQKQPHPHQQDTAPFT